MKINTKPIAYAVIDASDCNKFSSVSKWCADSVLAADPGGERNRVEPLYPESLVIELAQMLKRITDVYAEVRREISEDHADDGWTAESMTIDESRALLKKITDGSAT